MTTQGSPTFHYFNKEVSVSDFPNEPQVKIPFLATKVILINDADEETVSFSFLKPRLDGELFCTDGPISFDGLSVNRIWLKTTSDPARVRGWAWRL